MIIWTKKDLEEMCGDDVIDQLAFLAGCFKHKLINDEVTPDGWIIPDESLRKFAELIVRECAEVSFKHWERHKECSAHFSIREHFGVRE